MSLNIKSELGMSSAGVLVGIAMSFMGLKVFSDVIVTKLKVENKISNSIDKVQINSQIVSHIDCDKTFYNKAYLGDRPIRSNGVLVELRNSKDKVILPFTGKQIGQWRVKAVIEENPGIPNMSMLQLRIAKPRNNAAPYVANGLANYLPDPFNSSLALDWNHPNSSLFTTGVPICGQYFAAGSPTQCKVGEQSITDPNTGELKCAACRQGETVVGFDRSGNPTCGNSLAQIDCGSSQLIGARLANGDIVCVDKTTANHCPSGQKFERFNANGSTVCTNSYTEQQCPIGFKQSGTWPNGVPKCSLNMEGVANTCAAGQVVAGLTVNGQPICAAHLNHKICQEGTKQTGVTSDGEIVCDTYLETASLCTGNQILYGIDATGRAMCTSARTSNKVCGPGTVVKGYDIHSNPVCVPKQGVNLTGLVLKYDLNQCNWVQNQSCTDCVAQCPNGRVARETRVNFSGGGGAVIGNLEVHCCQLIAGYL